MGNKRVRICSAPSASPVAWLVIASVLMLSGPATAAFTYDRVIEFISPDTGNSVVITGSGGGWRGPAGSAMIIAGMDDGAASGMITLTTIMSTVMGFMSTVETVMVAPLGAGSMGTLPGPMSAMTGMFGVWPPKFFARTKMRDSFAATSAMFSDMYEGEFSSVFEVVPVTLMGGFVNATTVSGTFMTGMTGFAFPAPGATGPLAPIPQVALTATAPPLSFVTLSGAFYTIAAFDRRTPMGLGVISAVVPVQLGRSDGTTSFYFIRDTFTVPEAADSLMLGATVALLIVLSRLRRRRADA